MDCKRFFHHRGMGEMVFALTAFSSLFSAVFMLLAGIGLLTALLSLRMTMEGFSVQATGIVMSFYFMGLGLGQFLIMVSDVSRTDQFMIVGILMCPSLVPV